MSTAVVASVSTRTPHKETTVIHFIREGDFHKLGLNLSRTPGGFTAIWVWFDIRANELTTKRLRVRLHCKPRLIVSAYRHNVIDNFLQIRNLELVNKEVLSDLVAVEDQQKKTNEPYAYIKP